MPRRMSLLAKLTVRHLKILSRLGIYMYLYENEVFRVSVRNLTERVPDSFQLAVPKPVPYPNRFTPSGKSCSIVSRTPFFTKWQ